MLTSLLRFEARYQLRQKSFIGFCIIFLCFGFMLGSRSSVADNINYNSAYQINFNMALMSLGCVFAIMFFAISGILRDQQYGTASIVYSASIKKWQFFASRFTGVFITSLLVFSTALVGFALGTLSPSLDPQRLAAFSLQTYLWTWLVIVLPNIFICTTAIFSVGALTKNNIAIYLSAVILYTAYFLCALFFNSPLMANSIPAAPENMAIAALADPFGISAFFQQTQYWTPFQKNTQAISFTGNFMWNRLLWFVISLLLLTMTYSFFSFRKMNQKIRKAILWESEEEPIQTTYRPVAVKAYDIKAQLQSFWFSLKLELTVIFKSLPFIAIVMVWIFIVFTEIYFRINEGGAYNDSLYPTTRLLIWLIKDPLPVLALLLIVFYSGESVWRERSLKFDGIIEATPASNAVFFLSKGISLALLPVLLITISICIAMGFQLTKGYFHFEILQYLSFYYFSGIGLLFYILFALFIQSLVHNKYIGMTLTGLVILLFGSSLATLIGIEHPLLRIGHLPEIFYTDMTGYGDYAKPFHHYALHWVALGLILAIVSFKLWQRGNIHQWRFRIKLLFGSWKGWELTALLLLTILLVTTGATIFYNTNVVNEYRTINDDLDFREAYERKYKVYEGLESLVLVDAKTEVEIFPDENKFTVKANYILENANDFSVSQLLVSERLPLKSLSIENAELIEQDTFFDTRLYQFNSPLQPGQQLKFAYELIHEKKGFESDFALVNNGSYIMHHLFEPVLGYRSGFEITNSFERKKRGLPKRKEEVLDDAHIQNDKKEDFRKVNFETIVSTQSDQRAIAPGALIKHWTDKGRNFYHYKTPQKIVPSIAYFSAAYKVKMANYKGISIELYYHPTHEFNIDNIMQSTKLTLDYCIANFGVYPFDHLRIAEIPGHWPFGGQAMAGTISMVANRLYVIDNRNETNFDLVAKRTIHEVAHQWWGYLLTPKSIEGASLITEGFAKYTEAVVMEEKYGKRAIWQLSETAQNKYFSDRSFASEAESPLYLSQGQGYLSYGKNFIVMMALKELIGEAKVNAILSHMFEIHKDETRPTATSLELLDEIYKATPKAYHQLIDDWFKNNITYDLKLENVAVDKLSNDKYEVTFDVSAKRFKSQPNGEYVAVPIDEPISIGIFSSHPKTIADEHSVLHLKPHRINGSQMQFTIVVDEFPKYIAIDPFGSRLDENRVDNIFRVK